MRDCIGSCYRDTDAVSANGDPKGGVRPLLAQWRLFLDNWRFWIIVAYILLAALIILLFRINSDIAKENANEAAQAKAFAVSRVEACRAAIRVVPDQLVTLGTVERLARAARDTLQDLVDQMPNSPLTPTRVRAIQRYDNSLEQLAAYALRIANEAPSPEECQKLGQQLGVYK